MKVSGQRLYDAHAYFPGLIKSVKQIKGMAKESTIMQAIK